jgi:conjugal transfer pilus assembly protein TraK
MIRPLLALTLAGLSGGSAGGGGDGAAWAQTVGVPPRPQLFASDAPLLPAGMPMPSVATGPALALPPKVVPGVVTSATPASSLRSGSPGVALGGRAAAAPSAAASGMAPQVGLVASTPPVSPNVASPPVSPNVASPPVSPNVASPPVSPSVATPLAAPRVAAPPVTIPVAAAGAPASDSLPLPTEPAVVKPPMPPFVPTAEQQSLIRTGVASMTVRPGETNIFPVALGRVNRIITPFRHAKVSTEAASGIEVRDGVIYLTPGSVGAISMFVTEDGDESVAISLTLVPSGMPPVSLELRLPGDVTSKLAVRPGADRGEAARFERQHPYVDMLRALMRGLALGRVPAGYELHEAVPVTVALPRCAGSPVAVDFTRAQYVLGASVEVVVGVVSNPGRVGLDFTESWCGEPGVLAVALSPTPFIAPGAASEIYIARRVTEPEDDQSASRPSLVKATK